MKVLFLCLGNVCRSQMAEYILRKEHPEYISVSAALNGPSNQSCLFQTMEILKKNGIHDCDAMNSKGINIGVWDSVDVVVNMTGKPKSQFRNSEKILDWDVFDPFGKGESEYQRCFEIIESKIKEQWPVQKET